MFVAMKGNLCACGDLSYIAPVLIMMPTSAPRNNNDNDNHERCIACRFGVFSAVTNSIVWMCDSTPLVRGDLGEDPCFWFQSYKNWNSSNMMLLGADCNKARPIMVDKLDGNTFEQQAAYKLSLCKVEGPSGHMGMEEWSQPIIMLNKFIVTAKT
jgi:hypothetical protein